LTDLSTSSIEHMAEFHEPGLDPLGDEAAGVAPKSASPTRLALRRFLRHKAAVASLVVLVVLVLMVIFAPTTARYTEIERLTNPDGTSMLTVSPRGDAWFGTDQLGRDLYARIIWGGRVSLAIGIAVAFFSALIGTIIGSIAGWRGGIIDDALMRVTDIFLAFPLLVALLVMRNLFAEVSWLSWLFGEKESVRFIVVLLSLVAWMLVARLVRGTVLSLKQREFVEAARALGATDRRIVLRHLIPNSLGPIVVAMTTTVAVAIITESTLSFFGYGPNPAEGRSSWGNLLREADGAITTERWWLAVFPGLFLVITVLCVNFVGDGLRDAFDPKQRRHQA
jgi:peptide/nickel transport system permease protein